MALWELETSMIYSTTTSLRVTGASAVSATQASAGNKAVMVAALDFSRFLQLLKEQAGGLRSLVDEELFFDLMTGTGT